jgi:nitrite reductase (NADH) small subunit
MSTSWSQVCALEDIAPLGARVIRRSEGDIALFRTAEDEVFALRDRCPHKGGPLSQGIVFGKHVACPLHNWTIGLVDGTAAAPDVGCTPRYACKVEDGIVFIDFNSQAALRPSHKAAA